MTTLDVKLRAAKGTADCRRLRETGWIPAILYGGEGQNVDIALDSKQVTLAVRKGLANFELQGDLTQKAVLKAVQYDGLGSTVLHVDLLRA